MKNFFSRVSRKYSFFQGSNLVLFLMLSGLFFSALGLLLVLNQYGFSVPGQLTVDKVPSYFLLSPQKMSAYVPAKASDFYLFKNESLNTGIQYATSLSYSAVTSAIIKEMHAHNWNATVGSSQTNSTTTMRINDGKTTFYISINDQKQSGSQVSILPVTKKQ